MYKHLLVPVDESELSIANVGEAVKLARSFATPAKVTFFHATADYAASGEGSRAKAHMQDKLHRAPLFSEGSGLTVREMKPDEYRERVLGQSRALLAKACAAAADLVAFDTHSILSDQPAEAIVKAAKDCGCDLIVMASHGRSGLRALLSPSVSTKVIRQAGVPVLVTRTESTDAHVEASRATALIQDEHRSLAAVIYGMKRRVAEARSGAAGLDREGFERLLQYIHDFPEKRHHPKEEQSLHRLLREHGDRGRELMHTLEGQHLKEYELAAALQGAWAACGAGAAGVDPQLVALDQARRVSGRPRLGAHTAGGGIVAAAGATGAHARRLEGSCRDLRGQQGPRLRRMVAGRLPPSLHPGGQHGHAAAGGDGQGRLKPPRTGISGSRYGGWAASAGARLGPLSSVGPTDVSLHMRAGVSAHRRRCAFRHMTPRPAPISPSRSRLATKGGPPALPGWQ